LGERFSSSTAFALSWRPDRDRLVRRIDDLVLWHFTNVKYTEAAEEYKRDQALQRAYEQSMAYEQ